MNRQSSPFEMDSTFDKKPLYSGWHFNDEDLYCDGCKVEDIVQDLKAEFDYVGSPFYLYSASILERNVKKYLTPLKEMLPGQHLLSYAVKANWNPSILKVILKAGVSHVTCVSGNEVLLALKVGVFPNNVILNGNGKRRWEIKLAIKERAILNVDSAFDSLRILEMARELKSPVKVLIRINPDVDPYTHPYLATALKESKFGVDLLTLKNVLSILKTYDKVVVLGVHVHVGSAVNKLETFAEVAKIALKVLEKIRKSGWPDANIINLGGGLDVEPCIECQEIETERNKAKELIEILTALWPKDVTLLLEPGRSIVADSGILVTEVLGVKSNGDKHFVVVDASMTELIRPALYNAKHPVSLICGNSKKEPSGNSKVTVVGPVCESGDFLAKDVTLPASLDDLTGQFLATWIAGAYGASMGSNYNMRPLILEVLVMGSKSYKVIRRPQDFLDIVSNVIWN